MVEGIIGKKIGMSQVFDETGNVIPVTVILAGPCAVIQKKTPERDGYAAVQLGFVEDTPPRNPGKPALGHFKASEIPPTRVLKEFRFDGSAEIKPGDQFSVDLFQPGDTVHVTGTSKGKGFAGVVKRHNFSGGPGGHGSHFHRSPGSIGQASTPSRVFRGQRMAGQMGNETATVRNLEVVKVDPEQNLLIVRGAVPGAKGALLTVRSA